MYCMLGDKNSTMRVFPFIFNVHACVMVCVCVCMCERTGICIFVCVCLGGWVYVSLKLWAPLYHLNVTTETLPLLWHHQNSFLIFFWSRSLKKDLLYNRGVYRCLCLSFRYDSARLSVCHSAWSNRRSTQTSGHLQAPRSEQKFQWSCAVP